jgi:hypothetical protein
MMVTNQGFSRQNGSKLGHSKYWRIVWKRALEMWRRNLANCEVTPQAI